MFQKICLFFAFNLIIASPAAHVFAQSNTQSNTAGMQYTARETQAPPEVAKPAPTQGRLYNRNTIDNSAAKDPADIESFMDAETKAIWDRYKALAAGEATSEAEQAASGNAKKSIAQNGNNIPAPAAPTSPTKPSAPSASGFSGIIETYNERKANSGKMQSLRMSSPDQYDAPDQ